MTILKKKVKFENHIQSIDDLFKQGNGKFRQKNTNQKASDVNEKGGKV